MTTFEFVCKWQASGNDAPAYQHTMADLALHVGNINLMMNENIWSRTIRESALLSAYPLALWLASSWWRLHWEPLPAHGVYPSVDWRMAHELGTADHGFVWPQVIFASDGEVMQIWAGRMQDNDHQSVRYLNGLEAPASVALADFQHEAEDFISIVLNRLDAHGYPDTDLANLWNLIQTDISERESFKYRRLEATMGYEPDECPEELIAYALELENKMGEDALSELIPIYGRAKPLTEIEAIVDSDGLFGVPQPMMPDPFDGPTIPWQRGVATAGALRKALGNTENIIDNTNLCELLGLRTSDVETWVPNKRHDAALAVPTSENQYKFIPRKKHPLAKRFELARFIGDCIWAGTENRGWLTSTDLSTSRQKYQRAFAAEFLCPIKALREFLQDDFSESAIEDAVEHFQVSETTITSSLVNNQQIPFFSVSDYSDNRLPYHSTNNSGIRDDQSSY